MITGIVCLLIGLLVGFLIGYVVGQGMVKTFDPPAGRL